MINIRFIFCLLLIIMVSSCKSDRINSYAIRDFRSSLQPLLLNIVSTGIVGTNQLLTKDASNEELKKLILCEHPVLRADAFRILLKKQEINNYTLLMSHLDDTAKITRCAREGGVDYSTVSDDIIEHSFWESGSEKNKTIDKVITEHSYLKSAYKILHELEPKERYYDIVKKMARQTGYFFYEIEEALFFLASFRKKEDIKMIKEILSDNTWNIGHTSFRLMQEFPDTDYLEILEKYHKRILYRQICDDNEVSNSSDFFDAVASYKVEESAKILSSVLNRKPFIPDCIYDTGSYKYGLYYSIWNNQCKAYSTLITQIKPAILEYEKNRISIGPMPPSDLGEPVKITW